MKTHLYHEGDQIIPLVEKSKYDEACEEREQALHLVSLHKNSIKAESIWREKAQKYLNAGRWAGRTHMEAIMTELEERDAQLAAAQAELAQLRAGPAVEAQPDPYARLKAAWKAGSRIRLVGSAFYRTPGFDVCYDWISPPENYEIHPDDLHFLDSEAPEPAELQSWSHQRPYKQPTPAEASQPEPSQPADNGMEWTEHDGGPCPLKDEAVKSWEYQLRDGRIYAWNSPSDCVWLHDRYPYDIVRYRVLEWQPGHGPDAKAGQEGELAEARAKWQAEAVGRMRKANRDQSIRQFTSLGKTIGEAFDHYLEHLIQAVKGGEV